MVLGSSLLCTVYCICCAYCVSWGGECLRWWTSGVVNVWFYTGGGEKSQSHISQVYLTGVSQSVSESLARVDNDLSPIKSITTNRGGYLMDQGSCVVTIWFVTASSPPAPLSLALGLLIPPMCRIREDAMGQPHIREIRHVAIFNLQNCARTPAPINHR